MTTEEINFYLTATALRSINVYIATFAGCDIELAEDKQSYQLIGENGDHETWDRDEDGSWSFREGCNLNWPDDYYESLESAIEAL